MKVCIDTSAYTALRYAHEDVVSLCERADSLLVPAVVLGELYAGFHSGKKVQDNMRLLEDFLETPGVEVHAITHETARRYGLLVKELRLKGKPIPTNDIWVAAATLETGAHVLTADRHFEAVPGLPVIAFSPAS